MSTNDSRNVIDKYKGWPHDDIVADLDKNGVELQIAIENLERDFNMGTIVRSANAFGVRTVHIIGRKQWNKRGAMMTDKYLNVIYHKCAADFIGAMRQDNIHIVAVDNIQGATNLRDVRLPSNTVLIFGSEGSGISQELTRLSDEVVAIEQLGSTRSLNVGVAAGVVMYQWLSGNHKLNK